MFEITDEHVAALQDADLRELIGRLCEAELRRKGLPASSITWGGNQNAADGGIDVNVDLPETCGIEGFIPRRRTAFQAKAEEMSARKIFAEMRPKGRLRPAIHDLMQCSGAYIIVSSRGSVSHTSLRRRHDAMRQAVNDVPGHEHLELCFFDRNRIATWIRQHGGLIAWVRDRIGRSIQGWKAYGAWSYSKEEVASPFLTDASVRIRGPHSGSGDGEHVLAGIMQIRSALQREHGIVRIVGLSGVGKTRLAQALFDERLGEAPLDPSIAYYTNISDDPTPTPVAHASDLVASEQRAILVVDNCTPELHRQLTEVAQSGRSKLSILSIEYDIREDQAEGTDVFEVLPSSATLIEKLVAQRYPALSQVDVHTIADFSGGNARVAIALSETVGKDDSITGLKDEELFRRLFQQRHEPSDSLLTIAKVCSLVYSFNGEVSGQDDAELSTLALVAGISARELFKGVAELQRRDLVQHRGVWRAVLPHAVANRLAALALQDVPLQVISDLVRSCSSRLLKSFSRRLGYLDRSVEARVIVSDWLRAGGLLGNVGHLDELGRDMLDNVAPVAPEAALLAFEREITGTTKLSVEHSEHYRRLLYSLAYEAALFGRSVAVIIRILEGMEGDPQGRERSVEEFASLFPIYLSGTHASIEQRLFIVEGLLVSESDVRQTLGSAALNQLLEAWHFSGFRRFDFGARSRDYGYEPRDGREGKHWFAAVLQLCERLGGKLSPCRRQVRKSLASKLRGVWSKAGMYDEVLRVCKTFAEDEFWPEGWNSACSIRQYDSSESKETQAKLRSLLDLLRPSTLVEEVRALVHSRGKSAFWDFDYDNGEFGIQYARMEEGAYELGRRLVSDETALQEALPHVLLLDRSADLFPFARGLIEGSSRPITVWELIVAAFIGSDEAHRSDELLCGCFVSLHRSNPEYVENVLDMAVEDRALARLFPTLQSYIPASERAVARIEHSITLGVADIGLYRRLCWPTDSLSGADFARLTSLILKREAGFPVALDLIWMRIFAENRSQKVPEEVLSAGRELLSVFNFSQLANGEEYHLARVAEQCLLGEEGARVVEQLSLRLKAGFSEFRLSLIGQEDLIRTLLKVQPLAMLEGLFSGTHEGSSVSNRIQWHLGRLHGLNLDPVPCELLVRWCAPDPDFRFPVIATMITPFAVDQDGRRFWTSFALELLDAAPSKIEVLRRYIEHFFPTTWSGSRVSTVEQNAGLLDALTGYKDKDVAQFARQERERIRLGMEKEGLEEARWARQRDERFE